ncbi:MAG TPA: hypothetical protein DEV81_24220 [Cyanobacteria bacterium UBA11049]|nr:hypothetical protein [Cyanobacteria bacterium UBA11049]
MGLIAVRLDPKTEAHLADILAHEKTDRSELIRRLINRRWLSLQAGKQTIIERIAREPHLFDGSPGLSDRNVRKRYIAKRLLEENPE